MIVALQGGLANQLFQWAFGVSVAKARNEDVFFTHFRVDQDVKRSYSLDAFNMNLKFVSHEKEPYFFEGGPKFNPEVYKFPYQDATYIGYWQTEKYFNESLVLAGLQLRREPSQQTLRIAEEISKPNTCFIHVRRGDYVSEPHTSKFHGNLSTEYYEKAIDYIRQRVEGVKFFVFSDDPGWCRYRYNHPEFIVVEHNYPGNGQRPGQEHEDLFLMGQADHAIVANSAFSWWAAWLGDKHRLNSVIRSARPHRIVIAPKQWFADPNMQDNDIVEKEWVQL